MGKGKKIEPNNYASFDPLNAEELIEKLAEFQRNADAHEADLQDAQASVKEAKGKLGKALGKVAQIGRSKEQGHALYLLNGGELTEETPDTDQSLPFGGGEEAPFVDLSEGDEAPEVVEEKQEEPVAGRVYPKGQDKQVYQRKSDQNNTCTVKQQSDGWYGRVSGKPIATKVPLAEKAMRLVDEHLNEDEPSDWLPTITLDDPEDVAPKKDPKPEPEDLTGGL